MRKAKEKSLIGMEQLKRTMYSLERLDELNETLDFFQVDEDSQIDLPNLSTLGKAEISERILMLQKALSEEILMLQYESKKIIFENNLDNLRN